MKTTYRQSTRIALPILILIFFGSLAFAQEGEEKTKAKKSSIFELFSGEGYTEFDMTFSFDELERLKKTDEYLPAVIELENDQKEIQKWELKIKVRGRYRRRICDFPPIKLEFDKDDLEDRGYKKDDDMKLVTHCVDDYSGKENVLREYLAYKLFEIHHDRHFRTQLLKVRYIDSESNKKTKGIGILIEDNETVERRLQGETCDNCFSVPKDSFYLDNLHVTALFQYMIGNADWSLTMCRNLEMMRCDIEDKFFVVPYDFDFSGLVSANYAVPNADYNQKNIRDRVFLGYFDDINELKPYVEYFKSKKEEVLEYVKDFKELSAYSRRDITEYLEAFYDELESGAFYSKIEKK